MLSALLLDVSPHVSFGAEGPCVGEVVDLLELVHVLQLGRPDQVAPHAVPGERAVAGGDEVEACSFKGVDNTVVDMGLRDFEG